MYTDEDGVEHLAPMTVDKLLNAMLELKEEGKGELPITVAFFWDDYTIQSDIISLCLNGESVQLNEHDFEAYSR